MRAQIWTGDGFEWTDALRVRDPGDGEVLVEIAATGLCHSDLNPVHGRYDQPVPAVLGHEAVGRVVAAGTGAEHLAGRRVVLSPLVACGTCRSCRRGSPTTCLAPPPPKAPPFTLDGAAVHPFVRLGTFTERTVVAAAQVVPIGDELPDAAAALLGCAVVTGTGAAARGAVTTGDAVLVTGAGGIGLNAIQEARRRGAERVVACDRLASKEAIARRMGATDFVVTPAAADVHGAVRELVRGGVDVAIECTGRPDVLEACIRATGPGGRIVIVGLPAMAETVSFKVRALADDKALLGCRMGSVDPHTAIPALVEHVVAGRLELDPLVSKVVGLDGLGTLIADLEAGRLDRGVMMLDRR